MVKWVAHVVLGLGASLLILSPNVEHLYYVGTYSAIGSLIPDLDLKFKHRRFLHNIWTLILIVTLHQIISIKMGLHMPLVYILSLIIGFTLHIIADGLTTMGVYPLWPLNFKLRVSKMRYDDITLNLLIIAVGLILASVWFYNSITSSHATS